MSVFTTLVSPVDLRETFYLTYMSYTRPRVFFKGNDTGHFSYILRESRVKLTGQTNKSLLLVERILCPLATYHVTMINTMSEIINA